MEIKVVLAIICFIFIGITALNIFGDPRTKTRENFESSKGPDNIPEHLLKDVVQVPRPLNNFGSLTQQQCYEQDGNRMVERVSDFTQRTNNYKHTYPDSCSAPFKELVGSFYYPRDGSIGAPIPKGSSLPTSVIC